MDAFDGKGLRPVLDDYSIQPGTGGYGMVLQWAAYKNVKAAQLLFNGNYLLTPDNTNDVARSSTSTNLNTKYNSITDQYLIQAGIAMPVSKVRGLTLSPGRCRLRRLGLVRQLYVPLQIAVGAGHHKTDHQMDNRQISSSGLAHRS